MADHDSWDYLRNKLAKMLEDKQYEPFLPLLDFLKPRLNAKADDRNLELAQAVFAVVETLHAEKEQGADTRTYVKKMSGGFVQRIVAKHVQQANRDFVINIINNIKSDVQPDGSIAGDRELPHQQIDPKILAVAEQNYRQRIKERFGEDVPYYIDLQGETTEVFFPQAKLKAPRSAIRRRVRAEAEYREWIQSEQEIKRMKLKSLREGVDKYPCIILLGDPGCGKTTALEQLAFQLAGGKERFPILMRLTEMIGLSRLMRSQKTVRLPLPIRLSEFEPGLTVEQFLYRSWAGKASAGHWEVPELAANLDKYLKAGKLFCLLDALNEMPQKGYKARCKALRQFIDRWSPAGNRFLVTCRVLDYGEELSGLQRIEIQPMSNEQIEAFLQNELPQDWEIMWQRLVGEGSEKRRLLEMARNPYILTMMIDVFDIDGDLGRKRSELMTRFTEILIEWARRKTRPDLIVKADALRTTLERLAFEIQNKSGFGTVAETELIKSVSADELETAASTRIIEMPVDRSSVRFYHQLLQEYFAAREMLKQDPATLTDLWRWPWLEKDMPKWVRLEGNWDPLPPPPPANWEETTILAAGMMPQNDDQLVRALIQANSVLAGRCIHEGKAEVAPDVRRAVIDRLLATISDPKVALRVRIAAGEVLGYLGDPRLGGLATIPAGKFLMGDDQDDYAKPQHEVFLPEYQIGKYPVTNLEFAEFIESGGYNDARWWTDAGWSGKERETWVGPVYWNDVRYNKPNQPVAGNSWYECLAYCRWLSSETGKPYRLPSEAEWEKAARGTDGRQYPWGNEFDASCLNCREGGQVVMTTTPVGIYSMGTGSYGCLDMAGNVSEWTRSLWGKGYMGPEFRYPYESENFRREDVNPGDEVHRVLRGGSWLDDGDDARCTYRYRRIPGGGDGTLGFRVVVSPISAL